MSVDEWKTAVAAVTADYYDKWKQQQGRWPADLDKLVGNGLGTIKQTDRQIFLNASAPQFGMRKVSRNNN